MSTLKELYEKHEQKTESTFVNAMHMLDDVMSVNSDDFGFKDVMIDTNKGKATVDGKKMSIDEFNSTYKNASGMNYFEAIKSAANAETDDDVMDVIIKMSEPEKMDRKEAQETYTEYLGYDPTTYYDEKEIDDKLRKFEVEEGNPRSLVENHDAIVDSAMKIYEMNRDYNEASAIKQAMKLVEIDEDIISKFDKVVQGLAIDDDDDEDEIELKFKFGEDEEPYDDEDDSLFSDDDFDDED